MPCVASEKGSSPPRELEHVQAVRGTFRFFKAQEVLECESESKESESEDRDRSDAGATQVRNETSGSPERPRFSASISVASGSAGRVLGVSACQ